jgi:hypothetical protein
LEGSFEADNEICEAREPAPEDNCSGWRVVSSGEVATEAGDPKFDSKSGNFAIFNFLLPFFSTTYWTALTSFRNDPRLHLIRPSPVPTAATANRENLYSSLHEETPS